MNTLLKCSRQLMKLRNQAFLLPHAIATNLIPPPKFSKHIDSVRRLCSAAKRDIQKVCIVCSGCSRSREATISEYMVFVVDLKWDKSGDEIVVKSMAPTVRFGTSFKSEDIFCVLGSTLYLFDGNGGKSMYTYQLSDGISNLKLEQDMLSKGPSMHEDKAYPRVIATPNGKILVFNQTISCSTPCECDFELYDPVDGVWQKLPSLRPSLVFTTGDFNIESFTFFKGNVFFVKTEVGAFTLDIAAPNKVWKINGFHCAGGLPPHIGTSLVLVDNQVFIIPHTAFDITKYEENEDVFFGLFYEFPDQYENTHNYVRIYGGSVLLLENRDDEAFNVCFLEKGNGELRLQVYSCNLKEYREKLLSYRQKKIQEHTNWLKDRFELPGAKKVKTLTIVAKTNRESYYAFNSCTFNFNYLPENNSVSNLPLGDRLYRMKK